MREVSRCRIVNSQSRVIIALPLVYFAPLNQRWLYFVKISRYTICERGRIDQIKIGKFIAERRKQNSLTQIQLAEKLNITDKAISKWERGLSLPDSSIMLELCGILGITVNDLLSGEAIAMDNYNKALEKKFALRNRILKARKFSPFLY